MSYAPDVATRPTTDAQGARTQGHPRGRGFSILSRLAREQGVPAEPAEPAAAQPADEVAAPPAPEPVAPQAPADLFGWRAPVVPLERPEPEPRHRRAVAVAVAVAVDVAVDVETEDFAVSAVPVARRSS
jgi:hypothetical protein